MIFNTKTRRHEGCGERLEAWGLRFEKSRLDHSDLKTQDSRLKTFFRSSCLRVFMFIMFGLLVSSTPLMAASTADTTDATAEVFRAAANSVMPSIVRIETFGGVTTREARQIATLATPGQGPTTGLIIDADGLILTSSFNFLRKPPIVTVTLPDGSRHVAKMLGTDHTRKLTLLKIEGVKNLPVPTFAPRKELQVGQWAISVGIGYGDDQPALSTGIISATSRIGGKAAQTDANISPANYGGPLLDTQGRVIGVCVPLSPGADKAAAGVEWYDSGIGFAIPIEPGAAWLKSLAEGRDVVRGHMGINVVPYTSDATATPAVAAPVGNPAEKPVEPTLPDDAKPREDAAPPSEAAPHDDAAPNENRAPDDDVAKPEPIAQDDDATTYPPMPAGVMIQKVTPDSPAAKAGLEPNDRILAVNGTPVRDVLDLRWIINRFAAGETVTLTIQRGEERMERDVQLTTANESTQEQPAIEPAEPE